MFDLNAVTAAISMMAENQITVSDLKFLIEDKGVITVSNLACHGELHKTIHKETGATAIAAKGFSASFDGEVIKTDGSVKIKLDGAVVHLDGSYTDGRPKNIKGKISIHIGQVTVQYKNQEILVIKGYNHHAECSILKLVETLLNK